MQWNIPGTKLFIAQEDADGVQDMFESMFLPGDMVLSQVSGFTGLEAYTIQNWVKRGFLSPPQRKRYSMNQLCRLIHINMLKNALPLESVRRLLEYVNGDLHREEDDIIDDAALYFLFVRLAARARQLDDPKVWQEALSASLADYREPYPGSNQKIEKALSIMLTAWLASQMRQSAERMLDEIK